MSAVSSLAACLPASTVQPAARSDVDVINSVLSFIAQHHPETAGLIANNITFAETCSSDKRLLGFSWVTYSGGGWTVTVGHAAVPDYINDVTASYGNGKITWTGTEKNGQVTEASYNKTG